MIGLCDGVVDSKLLVYQVSEKTQCDGALESQKSHS